MLEGGTPLKISTKYPSHILWVESAGFLFLVALSWMDEYHSKWTESALESLAVIIVWVAVFYFTKRLLARVYYLEGFLHVCAWCNKIHYKDSWVPIEQYFAKSFATQTSHGMCPVCAEKIETNLPKPPVPTPKNPATGT
jgi:hypothetical protein